ncbi:MAG TPA: GAF domain-containing sensor histidine kinase [Acidimicrobiales bacterium]|nr:GAF domain-containing sensor histidine kinase [Acidimicrobiales bacterium]
MSELREVVPDESVRLRALAAVSDALVGATTDLAMDAVLKRLVCGARDLVGARYAALGVPDGEGGFSRFITDGMDDELVSALGPLPRSHGLLDAMLTQPAPYRTADIRQDPRFRGWWPSRHPDMRSFLGYPILLRGDVIGAFYLTDKVGAPAFDETDEQLVSVFAPHAAVLVEHSRLYEESRELSVAGERDRIARELHDALTQTLFGARLAVQTAAHALGDGEVDPDVATAVERLGRASRLLDDAFGELRALIYDLRPPDLAVDGLTGALRKQLDLLARTTELTVDLTVDGAAKEVAPETERQLFRIVQEAVANVVRHAEASMLTVRLGADGSILRLIVEDDGVGFDPAEQSIRSRRLGLTSMFDRARAVGGKLAIDSQPGAGTRVIAEVPHG